MSINSFENYPMSWKPDLSKTTGPKYLALAQLLEVEIPGSLKWEPLSLTSFATNR